MAIVEASSRSTRIAEFKDAGVRFVRLLFADLHGVARGKVIPIDEFDRIAEEGVPFVSAIMTVDLKHNVVAGFEAGFPDILAKPDVGTMVTVPWEPHVAWCLADLLDLDTHELYAISPRGSLQNVVEQYRELGLMPVLGPELEFYLCEAGGEAGGKYQRYMNKDSHVYTVGHLADRLGVLERMLETSVALGLGAFAANQEYGRGQYEINIGHSAALVSADRAFMFKAMVKEMAAREDLLATFMGKPWNDDEGSGFHLHISLSSDETSNVFDEPGSEDGLSPLLRHFVAGVLEHAPALMAFLNPTVNAYRRLHPEALVPTRVNWGHDNRFTYIRIPRERGHATRVEIRVADGTANPYLAYSAVLLAGLDGITRELEPPSPLSGLIYELPEDEQGAPLPATLPEAVAALETDDVLLDGMNRDLVSTFLTVKNAELARYRTWVSDWEFAEYSQLL